MIVVSIIIIVTDSFIIISKLYNRAELTELHKRTAVTPFFLYFDGIVNMGKLKQFQLSLSLQNTKTHTHTHTHTHSDTYFQFYKLFCKFIIFKLTQVLFITNKITIKYSLQAIKNVLLKIAHVTKDQISSIKHQMYQSVLQFGWPQTHYTMLSLRL